MVAVLVAGVSIFGYYKLRPQQNEELATTENTPVKNNAKKVLNVTAKILKPNLLTDEILTVGKLVPDEEVQLTFETSGKITEIYFNEGTFVEKGTLLASGFIAGGALMGVVSAIIAFTGAELTIGGWAGSMGAEYLGIVMYAAIIAYFIWHSRRAKIGE